MGSHNLINLNQRGVFDGRLLPTIFYSVKVKENFWK